LVSRPRYPTTSPGLGYDIRRTVTKPRTGQFHAWSGDHDIIDTCAINTTTAHAQIVRAVANSIRYHITRFALANNLLHTTRITIQARINSSTALCGTPKPLGSCLSYITYTVRHNALGYCGASTLACSHQTQALLAAFCSLGQEPPCIAAGAAHSCGTASVDTTVLTPTRSCRSTRKHIKLSQPTFMSSWCYQKGRKHPCGRSRNFMETTIRVTLGTGVPCTTRGGLNNAHPQLAQRRNPCNGFLNVAATLG
jgi:hypothetical protein